MTYPTNTEQLAAALNLSFSGLKTRFFRGLKKGLLTGPFSQKELRADQVYALVSLVADETNDETERLAAERLETERLEKLETERLERLEKLETEQLEKLETERLERLEKLETERLEKLETERLEKLETERLEKLETEQLRLDFIETKRLEVERKKAFAAQLVNTIVLNKPLMTNVSETQQSNDETIETTTQNVGKQPITGTDKSRVDAAASDSETQPLVDETGKPEIETPSLTPASVPVKYNKWPLGIFCFVMFLINLLDFVPKNAGLWATQPHIVIATFIVCLIPCWMEFRFASILLAIETRDLGKSFLWLLRNQWMALAVLIPAMCFQGFNIFELTWDVVKPDQNPNHIALPYFMTVFQLYGLIETVNMQKK